MDLSRRSGELEWMETQRVDPSDFARCLGDLAIVNRVTFAHRPTFAWLARATAGMRAFSLLDVGYGDGDLLRAIALWARRRGVEARLSGVDLDPSSRLAAVARTPADLPIEYRTGDVFADAPATRPDFIVSSLFTHHLTDAQVVAFLRWMRATAARAWFINDLHRSAVAYYGFTAIAWAARWHRFVRHDGPLSIARAFRRSEWERLLAESGVPGTVHWRLAFRLCVEGVTDPAAS